MSEYIINGIPVKFPFEPYSVQRAYMEKVIDCLNNSANGVLESPTGNYIQLYSKKKTKFSIGHVFLTGTGKTLSLLCSSLAWLTLKKQEVIISGVCSKKSFLLVCFYLFVTGTIKFRGASEENGGI